jgi:DNA-binding transcriptional LysR family regulator
MRALEEEFGCAIVKRGRAFESFTPEGERIFISAQRMLHEQELLLQDLSSKADQPVGALTLGAVPSVMPIAARFAGHLQARYPGLSLTVRSMSSPDIENGLENLSVDLGLGYTDRLKSRAAKLATLEQYTERYFLLRRCAQPSPSGLHMACQPMPWGDTAQLPLCLLTPEMHNRTIVDAAFHHLGLSVKPVIETNSILTLGLTVLVGEVCSILPGALVAVLGAYAELEAVPLVEPDVLTPIGFMWADSGRPSNALRAALGLAEEPAWLAHVVEHVGALK